MARLPFVFALIVCCGCAPGSGTLQLTVEATQPVIGIERLALTIENGGQEAHVDYPTAGPITIPPQKTVSLVFDSNRRGQVTITVDAQDAKGGSLGSGTARADLQPGKLVEAKLNLNGGSTADMGPAPDLVVADLLPPPLKFAQPVKYSAGMGTTPLSLVAGDVDGDGRQDLVTGNAQGSISVLLGNGTGSLAAGDVVGVTNTLLVRLDASDLDGDGDLDLVARSNQIYVILGQAGRLLAPPVVYSAGFAGLTSLCSGDLNKDGKRDLIVNAFYPAGDMGSAAGVGVLLGVGDGSFRSMTTFDTGGSLAIRVADLNSDGKPDVIAAANIGNTMTVLLGNGDGTLQAPKSYPSTKGVFEAATGDFNGDGKIDVISVNRQIDSVSVLLGNGDGSLAAPVDYATGNLPSSIFVIDLNRDGRLDLVTANYGTNDLTVLVGRGNGTFQPGTSLPAGAGPQFVIAHDFNKDGAPELVVSNYDEATIGVYLNTSP